MSLSSLERRQSDREWMHRYRDRRAAERVGPGMAAEVVGQNADLGRSWGAYSDRGQRRMLGRARVNRMLADAAMSNEIRRYRQGRTEVLGLISRLQSRADPYARFASRGSAAERAQVAEIARSGAPGCSDGCGCSRGRRPATPRETAIIHGDIARLMDLGYSRRTAELAVREFGR